MSLLPVRAVSVEEEARQHPLLAYSLATIVQRSFFLEGRGKVPELSEPDLRLMQVTYYGLISEVDAQIDRLIIRSDR